MSTVLFLIKEHVRFFVLGGNGFGEVAAESIIRKGDELIE